MKRCFLTVMILVASVITVNAQKDWTDWKVLTGDWVQFWAVVSFRDVKNTKDAVERTPLKKLKVQTYIAGLFRPPLADEIKYVKVFKILYTEFGKYENSEGFGVDYAELYYRGREVQSRHETVIRPALQFDVDQLDKPRDQIKVQHGFANDPFFRKVEGHIYRLAIEWRRKGNTVEIKLKDYRPDD